MHAAAAKQFCTLDFGSIFDAHSLLIRCRYDTIVALDEGVRQRVVDMGVAENPRESEW